MSAVRQLVDALKTAGLDAGFGQAGGNCYVIEIEGPDYVIRMGERYDPFTRNAWDSDAHIWGFGAEYYRLTPTGDREYVGELYRTPGEDQSDLYAEIPKVVEAVRFYLAN